MGISAIVFGACVTIFLGLQIEPLQGIFKNLALICGVLVTAVNGIDRFFTFRTAWIKQRVAILKLQLLKNEIEFYKVALNESEEIDKEKMSKFFGKYQEIWETITDEWTELRSPQKQNREDDKQTK